MCMIVHICVHTLSHKHNLCFFFCFLNVVRCGFLWEILSVLEASAGQRLKQQVVDFKLELVALWLL